MQQPDATTLLEKYQHDLCTAAELATITKYVIYDSNATQEFSFTDLDLDELELRVYSITRLNNFCSFSTDQNEQIE